MQKWEKRSSEPIIKKPFTSSAQSFLQRFLKIDYLLLVAINNLVKFIAANNLTNKLTI